MNIKSVTGLCLVSSMFFSGCDGSGCNTIAVPVYSLTVYDEVTGNMLCNGKIAIDNTEIVIKSGPQCEAFYSISEGNAGAGDITVMVEGYQTLVKKGVSNNRAQYRCFDSFSYTVDVDIFLTPNT